MAGLYIHIPFCRTKCAYCDFFSMPINSTQKKDANIFEQYCHTLLKEFENRQQELNEPITTIYIGGGTPTALPLQLLCSFIAQIKTRVDNFNHFSRASKSSVIQNTDLIQEFTVEANPEDITAENLLQLQAVGVNRISIGVQSFDSTQLNAIQRYHNAKTSLQALETLHQSGINYSADLIYGLPGQTCNSWEAQLKELLQFQPPHFSSYLLSYEPGTRLYAKRELGLVEEADEATAVNMYSRLIAVAKTYGYNHYEISNFALPGKEAVHNSSYWNLTPYLGLGCSAHSFDGINRRYNPSNLKQYLSSQTPIIDDETNINRINDYIITSLRTNKGLSTSLIREKWGSIYENKVMTKITDQIKDGKIIQTPNLTFIIPEIYWLTSDSILRELILDEE